MVTSSYPERLKMEHLGRKGLTDRPIAEQVGFSIYTVRKWRRRLQRGRKAAVVSQMGGPKQGPLSSFPVEMREQLKTWRKQHPGWGAKTLQTELSLHETFRNQPRPSRASLARWIKANGQVRLYEKHSQLPATPAGYVQACHAEWELDARGYSRVPNLGTSISPVRPFRIPHLCRLILKCAPLDEVIAPNGKPTCWICAGCMPS